MDTNNSGYDSRRMDYVHGNYTCMVHVVRQGDTLYRLSRQYGIKVSALMMANPFVDIYNLRIGDELCIPRLRRPEDMPVRPAPEIQDNMQMRPAPEIQDNMRTEEFYDESEPVIHAELPPMEKNRDTKKDIV